MQTPLTLRRCLAVAAFGGLAFAGAPQPQASTFLTENFDATDTAGLRAKGWDVGIEAKNEFGAETGTEFVVAPPFATANPETGEGGAPGGDFQDAEGNVLVFPPKADGSASGPPGKYLISDSDAAGGSDNIGSKSEFWATTPSFSTAGGNAVWLHVDADIENNNNGECIVDVTVSVDNGQTWLQAWATAEPQRPIKAFNFAVGEPGYEGSDPIGGYPVMGSGSLTKSWSGIHGRWHLALPAQAQNKPNVKVRFRYIEPADAWWIALDNLVIDDNPPPQGTEVILSEAFENGIPAAWKNAAAVNNKWGTEPLKDGEGKWLRNTGGAEPQPVHIDFLRGAAEKRAEGQTLPAEALARYTVKDMNDYPDMQTYHPNNPTDGRMMMMLAGGNYALWQEGADTTEVATLDTPVLNLTGTTGVYLQWDEEWIHGNASASHEVHVSVDGGTTFTRVFNHEGALSDRTEATYFMRQWLEVPSAAGMSAVVFRFRAAGGDPDQWEGFWVLDNVKVTANKAAPGGGLTAVNIGDAGGSTQDKGNGAYTLVGGGAVAFNADGDTLHFAYESITGDFDKKVKIKSLTGGASTRNRGGIMVRESVDPLSESLKLTASGLSSEPDQNGNPQGANNVELWVRSDTTANVSKIGRSYGNLTQNLPNQWLRLKRVGPYFASYVSTDGQNWSLIVDRYAPALGNAVLVGLYAASASEDLSSKATVEYEGYGNVTGTDNLPPTLVSAGTLDKKIVGVKFSELLNSSTVVAGNFQVSGATVGSASVGIGGDSVYLGVTGLAADTFTVTVSGVKDAAGNLIAANSQVGGKAVTGWTAVDVGSFATGPGNRAEGDDPILVGQSVAVGSGPQGAELEIVAGGSNIWNPGDFEHFVHTEKTGNFDVKVEVVRFDRSANTGSFGHAGIQVRESLYTEAAEQYTADGTKVRNVMNTTYAEGNVERSAIAIWRDEVDANYGNSPVIGSDAQINGIQGRWGRLRAGDASGAALANTSPTASRWLRLTRQGDEFISWYSYDGQTWQEHNRHTLALPAKVLVGFAEMADSPGVTGNNVNRAWHYNALHIRSFGDVAAPTPALTAVNIGDAGGSTQDKGNGAYTLVGGGAVAFNADGDTLHFAYESITGDFDKKVKIKSLTGGASTRNRGGIMVRESVDPLSESLKLTASGLSSEPDQNGNPQGANNVELWVRSDTTANVSKIGRSYGNLTQNLPNQWLRLKRVGPYFASYVSTDGQNWSLIVDRYAPALGNAVLVGLYAASASEDLSSKATVEYEAYSDVVGVDNAAPTLVSAATLDKKIVGVKFSELLSSSTVVAGNFQVSGATVGSASVGIGGDSVYLGVTGLAADTFTVTVSGVKDAAGNTIAANSQVGGKAINGWTAVDIGSFAAGPANRAEGDDPILPGQTVAVGAGSSGAELEIVAGGSNIWNPGDFEHFVHTEKTGNFDVAVEVVRFDRSPNTGSFGHAGIQVRESLYTEAAEQYTADGTKVRNVMNTTYAEGNVERSAIAIWRDEVDANYGNSPVIGSDAQINGIQGRWGRLRAGDATGAALPNTSPTASRWLRLTRQGDEFISWYSYDGQTWQEHNRHTLALPAKVLVGFAEMADSPGVTGNNVNRAWHYNALHIRNFGDIGTVQAPTLTVSRSGTEVRINWGGVGTLETSSAASGAAWSPIVGAPNPYVTQATADAAYYRSRIP